MSQYHSEPVLDILSALKHEAFSLILRKPEGKPT